MINLEEIKQSIELLKEEVSLGFKELDGLSHNIKIFETSFNYLKAFYPFKILIEESEDTRWYLSWKEVKDHPTRYRLIFIVEIENKNVVEKPFIETDEHIRLVYGKYFSAFINDFREMLRAKRENKVTV